MTSLNDDYEARVIAMVNTQLSNGVKDFGKIVDYIKITENMAVRYVFVTDTGRKIDSGSAMRFMNNYRRTLENRPAIVYPDGTDKVLRNRQMRVRRSGMRSLTSGQIHTAAKVSNDESIDITSTVTSAGAFPEEFISPKGKTNPNGLTIDEILERANLSVNEYFANKNEESDGE
jgi:hypothetical protein